ncbi:MAG: carboxypeptidase-like regulatory domain-containing protein, partial [Bacteroidota bacterium]
MRRKLLSVLLVILLSPLFSLAQQTGSQLLDMPISASFANQSLMDIFTELEKKYEVRFFYKEEWIPRQGISMIINDQSLRQVLRQLLASRGLAFAQYGEKAIIIGRETDLQVLEEFSYEQYLDDIDGKKKKAITSGFVEILGDSTIRPLPQTASIKGVIYDEETETVLPSAQIAFPQLQIGAISDEKGEFSLDMPTGKYVAEIEAPGHEKLIIDVWVYSDGEWEIPLYYTAYQLTEVLLEAESVGQSKDSPEAGKVNISIVDIRKRPALLGEVDIVNTVLLLPGVSSVGEAATGFNVRGGNVDQNLLMLGGNPIFNSSHLFGLFSVFNPDIVQNATLYKG